MRRRLSLQVVSAFVLFGMLLVPASGASASGYENIGGDAPAFSTHWYGTVRYISNAAAPGPEVAFYKYSGPSGLVLGAWDCSFTAYMGGGPFQQFDNQWQPVAENLGNVAFCMATRSNTSPGGQFNGDLNWD